MQRPQKKHKKIGILIWGGLLATIIIASCAKTSPLSGGPKDTTPPIVENSTPPNYATNFKTNEIEIEFNEFIQLEGVNQKLMVSPPLDNDPEINSRGKSLIIEINDQLKENTTYSFYFADAIVDLHESNPIENFQYVFSTGEKVDSMKTSGKVVNAYNKKPAADIYVMLYTRKSDSVPMKHRPLYITKTNENGVFELTNLKDTIYKIFALDDVNANYLYDLPNEKIAFTDSIIKPNQVTIMKSYKIADTASKDSLKIPGADASEGDTLKSSPESASGSDTLILDLFRDRDTTLKITTSKMEEDEKVILGFNKPVDTLAIKPLQPKMKQNWYLPEWNQVNDSVLLWLTDFDSDSLVLTFSMDSRLTDTLTFTYFKEAEEKQRKRAKRGLKITPQLQKNIQIPAYPMMLDFSKPLAGVPFKRDSLFLYSSEDTNKVAYEQNGIRQVQIDYSWKDEMNYRLYIPDSTFTDIFGNSNDSTVLKFSTKPKDEYGTLIVNASVPDTTKNYIINLLSKDEKTNYKTTVIRRDTTLKFKFLDPGKYKLKTIVDRNKNNVWDAGLYIKHEQPEEVIYYEDVIEIMANWEIEYDWKIKP